MKKIKSWIWQNLLFISSLVLLAFIPLYPKIPLLDIKNTWVYVRVEDFAVLGVLFLWAIMLLTKRVTLKTPLTIPIMFFWIAGAIATIHGVVLIFPTLANVFPNVAFLSYLRHLEYMGLFFIAYAGMRDKKFLGIVISVILITLLAIILYGAGQKYLSFPAYLTMNEEFAKGLPIQLSQLSRVPSTFAGHYDLAAYLVLVIPIVISLIFGFKNILIKIILGSLSLMGVWLLFMTVSRVSFFVLFISIFAVLFFQKKKLVLFSLPLLALFGFAFLAFQPSLFDRFGNTVKEVNVLVDAKSGESVGHVNYMPAEYFKDKVVLQHRVRDREQLNMALGGDTEKLDSASPSAIVPFELIPPEVPLVTATNVSTGENLPQGTGYINLSLSPVERRLGNFYYELPPDTESSMGAQVLILHGDFIVKRAAAYDLSFTTRFQGEWPRALEAFGRNIFFGSGYGSVSLAVDNNYFRMLGEIGLLGVIAFGGIFLTIWIYIKKVLPDVESKLAKSFVYGFAGGVIGLALNATLIDVFEASKVAFTLWLLTGFTLGLLTLYQKKRLDFYLELKKFAVSPFAVVLYLLFLSITIFSPMLPNYFVGDDFTWFHWAAESSQNPVEAVFSYFTASDGFFFRPGTKTYFYVMYSIFWLNQAVFHIVSIALHFAVAVLFFFLSRRILKDNFSSAFASFMFLMMSGYVEIVFWTSSTGHLFNAVFALLALLLFILWDTRRQVIYFVASLLSIALALTFHELGVVIPLLIILYKWVYGNGFKLRNLLKTEYLLLFFPVALYILLRFLADSHWQGGDYSYNLIKLPFNAIGNLIGYAGITFLGPISLSGYEILRSLMRQQILISLVAGLLVVIGAFYSYKKYFKKIEKSEQKIIIFGFGFFVISLLPFLGLGNIASRYSYLASLGLILLFALGVRKLYHYLLNSGKDIAIFSVATVVSVFLLFHVIQVQQIHRDWHGAGERVRQFFISIDALYSNYWTDEGVELHFVDVPIRNGEAWIFPVGLHDAVWLSFKDEDVKVFIHGSLEDALISAGNSLDKRIFVFQGDGSVQEVIRDQKGTMTGPRDKAEITPIPTVNPSLR